MTIIEGDDARKLLEALRNTNDALTQEDIDDIRSRAMRQSFNIKRDNMFEATFTDHVGEHYATGKPYFVDCKFEKWLLGLLDVHRGDEVTYKVTVEVIEDD